MFDPNSISLFTRVLHMFTLNFVHVIIVHQLYVFERSLNNQASFL